MMLAEDRLLTANEAADFLRLRLATIRRMTWQGTLPVVRVTGKRAARYSMADLQRLITERRTTKASG